MEHNHQNTVYEGFMGQKCAIMTDFQMLKTIFLPFLADFPLVLPKNLSLKNAHGFQNITDLGRLFDSYSYEK